MAGAARRGHRHDRQRPLPRHRPRRRAAATATSSRRGAGCPGCRSASARSPRRRAAAASRSTDVSRWMSRNTADLVGLADEGPDRGRRRRRPRGLRHRRRVPHRGDPARAPQPDLGVRRPSATAAGVDPHGACAATRSTSSAPTTAGDNRSDAQLDGGRRMTRMIGPIDPPPRLLMGPGPINADPRVLRAMSAQLVGQYDPWMTGDHERDDGALPRGLPHRQRADVPGRRHLPRRHRGRAGVACSSPATGCWCRSSAASATCSPRSPSAAAPRCTRSRCPGARCSTPEQIEAAVRRVRPKVLAIVQGDTSTTMCQPLADLGEICRRHDVLLYCDATASLGGNDVRDGRLGHRRRHRRAAEVPRRPVGQRADHHLRPRRPR